MKAVYTVGMVEALLPLYFELRAAFGPQGQRGGDEVGPATTQPKPSSRRERPFGMGKTDANPWPMMGKRHAKIPRDGKAKGRRKEEILVTLIDLELAFCAKDEYGEYRVSDDDVELLYRYYVYGMDETLDHLRAHLKKTKGMTYSSRGSMLNRVKRGVEHLVLELERPKKLATN